MTRVAYGDLEGTVASAVSGDDIAFARIVEAYHEDMRRVCAFVTRDADLAEDAVQSAWSIAWRKLGSVREPGQLRPWLVSVAVNQARDLQRKRRRRSETELLSDSAQVAGGIDPATGIEVVDVVAAMDRLEPEDRALIAMRYIVGFDATELAHATGQTPAANRQHLKRLLDRLRRELG